MKYLSIITFHQGIFFLLFTARQSLAFATPSSLSINNLLPVLGSTSTEMEEAPSETKRIAYLLFNPHAGQGDSNDELETIYNTLEPKIPVILVETKPGDKALAEQCKDIVKNIQSRPPSANKVQPIVIAAGGDGTVSIMADALIHTDIPLGIIPRGTANAFATALGIPTQSLEAACQHIVDNANTRTVDAAIAQTGERQSPKSKREHMILLAGIGWEANMVHTAQGNFKKALGKLAYIWGGVKETVRPTSFQCKLTIDDGKSPTPRYVDVETHSITVAVVAPAASLSAQGTGHVIPDDGLLDVTIQTCGNSTLQSLDAMVHLMTAAAIGEPTQTDHIWQLRVKSIDVFCNSKQRVVVDGELFPQRQKRFRYSIVPKALHVICPPSAPIEQQIEDGVTQEVVDNLAMATMTEAIGDVQS